MPTWILYALASMFFAGLTSVIAKFGLKNVSGDLGLAIRTTMVFVLICINAIAFNHTRLMGNFTKLSRELGISPRMLVRELQDLEMNKLISRTVYDSKLTRIEYSITETGLTLRKILIEMAIWGICYRKVIVSKVE